MLVQLEANRSSVSQTMALSLETRARLETDVAQLDELKKAIKVFLGAGKTTEAQRLAQQVLSLQGKLATTATLYESQKSAADNAIVTFRTNEQQVKTRLEKLENLKALQQINKIREQVQAELVGFNIDGAAQRFDQIAGKIERKALQLTAGDALADVSGQRADLSINKQLETQKVAGLLEGFKAEMALSAATGETQVIEGPASKATMLLSSPAFDSLALGDLTPANEPETIVAQAVEVEVVDTKAADIDSTIENAGENTQE
ncbi:hypothetical protein HN643_01850 [Candidatus Falkowbacteria bacterium]|nr:hypothetical protein [Candidatus Falkowbacteria bacterium]MBT6574033.1 hypothetical protein [Candidatus Falkowbacteria bacterium]MBT7500393.1 hypothetical protein [Candidatus Falkowbacteria bacterium]